ncbi:MAG TPA: hypothetical protein VGL29_25430, partial [Blastocatellia bacterium]
MPTNQVEQLIADEFGVNADYVSELLSRFEEDPSSVDDEWRSLFDELLENGRVVTEPETAEPQGPATRRAQPTSINVSPPVIHATYEWGRQAAAPAPEREPETQEPEPAREATAPTPAAPAQTRATEAETAERIPIRGPALRIAENMEASLAVPTATSQRQVPLKLLD